MPRLQTLLKTEKSTDELSSWGFAFEVIDGRCEYSTPIYATFLDAFAKAQITGKVLVFAADVFGVSRHPVYLIQLVPATKETDDEVRGPGFEGFKTFRALIGELSTADPGMRFLKELSEMGYATDPFGTSLLRGCIELELGAVTCLKQTNPCEKSLFELACKERYPSLVEVPASEEEERVEPEIQTLKQKEPMPEPIFNLFAYVHGEHVVALGAKVRKVDEDEATCLALLQGLVPPDALTATRYTFPPSEATETLPCGTVGLPVRHYEAMKMSGQLLDLFEPIFRQFDAPEAPLMCVTTVQDGVPINDDGPIYEGGTKESDRRFRHKVVLSKILTEKSELLRSTVRERGRGVFGLAPNPQALDFENREIVYLTENVCCEHGPLWDDIRTALSVYDPETQGIFVFGGPDGGDVYCTKIPTTGETAQTFEASTDDDDESGDIVFPEPSASLLALKQRALENPAVAAEPEDLRNLRALELVLEEHGESAFEAGNAADQMLLFLAKRSTEG